MDTGQQSIITIVAALMAPTLAAVVSAVLASRNASRAARSAAENGVKVDAMSSKLGQIHGLVNGRLDDAQETIKRLEAELYEVTDGVRGHRRD